MRQFGSTGTPQRGPLENPAPDSMSWVFASMGMDQAVEELGRLKSDQKIRSTNIDLKNHLTGYNALCKIWDGSGAALGHLRCNRLHTKKF